MRLVGKPRLALGKPIMKKTSQPEPLRAQRFTLRIPLSYRPLAEAEWIEGTIQNISRTGMLFRGTRPLAVGTRLQLSLTLPLKASVPLSVTVLCRGTVARIHPNKGSLPQIGAKFLESRLIDHATVAA